MSDEGGLGTNAKVLKKLYSLLDELITSSIKMKRETCTYRITKDDLGIERFTVARMTQFEEVAKRFKIKLHHAALSDQFHVDIDLKKVSMTLEQSRLYSSPSATTPLPC